MTTASFFWPSKARQGTGPQAKAVKKYYCRIHCKLNRGCNTPMMKPTGDNKKGIFILAEAPGQEEDRRGVQLIGESGQLLRNVLWENGISLNAHCRKYNAVNCHPPKNRTPKPAEIASCRRFVHEEIHRQSPKVIIPLGIVALKSLIGDRWMHDFGALQRWRGWAIPDRSLHCWICPTFHPAYLLRMRESLPGVETIFRQDITNALEMRRTPFPVFKDERECVSVILDPREALSYLLSLEKRRPVAIAFDYETTGLKPYACGHRIYSLSIAEDRNTAVAFLFDIKLHGDVWTRILADRRIGKIASNLKFEEIWSLVILKQHVRGWAWDTMLAAHIGDNRPRISSIKFQAYIRYGLIDYSSSIENYLKAKDSKNANAFNTIEKAPVRQLLMYNGMDSLLERRCAEDQRAEIGYAKGVWK